MRSSDQEIRANVSAELLSTITAGGRIGVAVNGRVVTLSGEVGSMPERLAAKQAAMRVSGVAAVVDEVQVCRPATAL